MLAVVGVVTLLAGAIGLIRFGGRGEADDLGKGVLDAMGEGVLVTDREGASSTPTAPMPT